MISNIEKYNRNNKKVEKNIFFRLLMSIILAKNIFISFFSMLILSSCVYRNGLLFSVRNLTEDTLIIVTKKIIPEFNVSVNNYEIKSDSESENNIVRYINSSDTSFFVPPFFYFVARRYWDSHDVLSDNPEADGVIPGWKFIKRMKKGTQTLPSEIWNSERRWIISWEYEEIEREYSLKIQLK